MHLPRSKASSSDALFSVRNNALSILINSEAFMARKKQKTNELESMMASLLSLILKRRELILRRTNVFKKIRRNNSYGYFSSTTR